jgi:Ca2+-binding RTX toxin-like protein
MYEILQNGTYVVSSYSHYYKLELPESGNVFLNVAGDSGYSAVYDENLNLVANIATTPMYLEAGSYIVNAKYSSPNLAALNVYIPQFSTTGNLIQLDTGSYPGSSWDHYYGLTIKSAKNVFLDVYGDSGYSAVYDQDLNFVSDITSAAMYLDAGSYIIHADYSSKNQAELIVLIANAYTGNAMANTLIGNSAANVLNGLAGNDTIDGGTGIDTMIGGDGSDTYYVRDIGDIVTETNVLASTGGTDLVNSYLASYKLGTNVENGRILLTTAANMTGNTLNNVIYAGNGVNSIDGLGGTDTLSYQYATTSGTVGVTLNLSMLNASGLAKASGISGADLIKGIENIIGSNYNDTLTGNAGNNVLNGLLGADKMTGGMGNDTYYVDNTGDVVTETSVLRTEIDTVNSAVSYTLGANIENLVLIGAVAINGTGNALNNTLTGNAAANILSGLAGNDSLNGGLGADKLTGGKGQDNLTGGAGPDTFTFAAGDDGITAATLDKILDYAKGAVGTGDLIDYSANLTKGGNANISTANQASINQSTGIATFAGGSGTTLADAVNDIATRFTAATDTAGEFAFFKVNNTGDYYLFVSDGTTGAGVNDDVIQLVGVTSITAIDLTSGNLTIIS